MDDQALAQLVATASALTGELAELRSELVEVRKELGELRRPGQRPHRSRLRHRERRSVANPPNEQAKANATIHAPPSGPECLPGDMLVQPQRKHEPDTDSRDELPEPMLVLAPTVAEIAALVVAELSPAMRAEFITAGNAEAVTGQDWRWVVAEAKRLGVPIGGTGKKRVVDIATFRAALAKGTAESRESETDASDPVSALRRQLGYILRKDGHA